MVQYSIIRIRIDIYRYPSHPSGDIIFSINARYHHDASGRMEALTLDRSNNQSSFSHSASPQLYSTVPYKNENQNQQGQHDAPPSEALTLERLNLQHLLASATTNPRKIFKFQIHTKNADQLQSWYILYA